MRVFGFFICLWLISYNSMATETVTNSMQLTQAIKLLFQETMEHTKILELNGGI